MGGNMSTFILFGNYSVEAFKGISSERTAKSHDLASKYGGEVKSIHALLGKDDLVVITEFPGVPEVMQFSVALSKMTGIGFTTAAAVDAAQFDKIMESVM
jgi:uncharacterized protein with GYD domain